MKQKPTTSWYALSFVILVTLMFTSYAAGSINSIDYEIPTQDISKLIELRKREQQRNEFLDKLRWCESRNKDRAVGDGGASIGPFQFQKPTLEDYLGYKVSYQEYYSIVTDIEKIRPITYDIYFNKGETWRWKICRDKINQS